MYTLNKITASGTSKIMSFKTKKAAIVFLHNYIADMKNAALTFLEERKWDNSFRYDYEADRDMNDLELSYKARRAEKLAMPIYVNPVIKAGDKYVATYGIATHCMWSRAAITTAIREYDDENWNVIFVESGLHVTFEIV